MKQVQQIGVSENVVLEKRKPVQRAPAAPFPIEKTKREDAKKEKRAAEAHRHDQGMNDAAATAAEAGRPLPASADADTVAKFDTGSRGGAGSSSATMARAADAAALAGQESLVDDLALLGADPGVFEVIMPEGDTLGVSVDHRQQSVMFLLSASNPALAKKLKRQTAELQSQLAQRMDTDVGLVVL